MYTTEYADKAHVWACGMDTCECVEWTRVGVVEARVGVVEARAGVYKFNIMGRWRGGCCRSRIRPSSRKRSSTAG